MPRVGLATANPGKVREIGAILARAGVEIVAPPDGWEPPEETGETYLDNARLKAHSLASFTGAPALADDSGIEVDALDGSPGVRSARYAGANGTDAENLAMLIEAIRDVPAGRRTARYRCVAVLAYPDGVEAVAEGAVEGSLIVEPRGGGGFGYDPIFVPAGDTRTMAELDPAAKDAISHRGKAFRRLLNELPAL